eukprot:TRINITY_DN4072_c0_g1_i1.p1 TRINITY_DN4072_c0_g1~~TRINITY_DN4072_c0_g1_i1.p1  ORF type:complete len:346 (+),score=51.96 TRINITY_DN4072_c0_g1_i1:61-1038(+)
MNSLIHLLIGLLLLLTGCQSFIEPPINEEVKRYCGGGGIQKTREVVDKDAVVGACLAWASYEMDKRKAECGMSKTRIFHFGSGKGFVQLLDNGVTKVVFRGTITVQDLSDDINLQTATFLSDPSLQVHKGYMSRYRAIRGHLLLLLSSSSSSPVQFIGHGSGAALAVLSARDFKSQNPLNQNVSVLTFGEPPFFEKPQTESLFEKDQRFVLTSLNYVLDPITTFGEQNFTHRTTPIFLCSELSIIRKADILLLHKAESYHNFLLSQLEPHSDQLLLLNSKTVVKAPGDRPTELMSSLPLFGVLFSASALFAIHRKWFRRAGYRTL